MFNIFDFAIKSDRPDLVAQGYAPYEVDPATVYPATIARIQAVLESGELPQELIDTAPIDPRIAPAQGAQLLINEALKVKHEGWTNALLPRQQFTKKSEIEARALALEVARRWFTRALHLAAGQPVGLQILKDETYKL